MTARQYRAAAAMSDHMANQPENPRFSVTGPRFCQCLCVHFLMGCIWPHRNSFFCLRPHFFLYIKNMCNCYCKLGLFVDGDETNPFLRSQDGEEPIHTSQRILSGLEPAK